MNMNLQLTQPSPPACLVLTALSFQSDWFLRGWLHLSDVQFNVSFILWAQSGFTHLRGILFLIFLHPTWSEWIIIDDNNPNTDSIHIHSMRNFYCYDSQRYKLLLVDLLNKKHSCNTDGDVSQ